MGVIFYTIFLWLYRLGIQMAALFNPKAKKWVVGRKDIFRDLRAAIPPGEKICWIHCASLGEFEQGRPVIEKLTAGYPGIKILLTFFSPSGYEIRKNYPGVAWVFYLPFDGARNAKRFLQIAHPSLVILVKYDFWYYYLKKTFYLGIPIILISAIFRNDMPFFKWYGGLQRKMLSRFDHLFVQNQESKKLLADIGLGGSCTVSGDTRFDRVTAIRASFEPIGPIEKFLSEGRIIIAGSTWPKDEHVLDYALKTLNDPHLRLVIAPHEINEKRLEELKVLFPEALLFSEFSKNPDSSSLVMIIDNIGMLSRLYYYGWVNYVGGGFTKTGVHNVLEAAVYEKPVLFGPNYRRFGEAIGLVETGGGISYDIPGELVEIMVSLQKSGEEYNKRSRAAGKFIMENQGATQKILSYIQEKRLLTK